MASSAMTASAIALLTTLLVVNALIMDREATNDVISSASAALNNDGDGMVVLLIPPPLGRNARREELLHAKGSDDTAIWLYYNKKSNKVTLETLHGGHIKSVSWRLGTHPSGTLVLVMTSDRVKLLVGCKPLSWHDLSGTYNLLEILSSQKLKLYHEENSPVKVFSSEKSALLSCNEDTLLVPSLTTVDEDENEEAPSDVVEVKDFLKNEERQKREEEMQGDQYSRDANDIGVDPRITTERPRGDIPSNGVETCDDAVIRNLELLRQTIEMLRREIGEQKGVIADLRTRLSQCCNRTPAPVVERCTSGSCYSGY